MTQLKQERSKRDSLVGRSSDVQSLEKVISRRRNLLIEGPVGVGKTYLVLQVLSKLGLEADRIDGDSRYTEQKLTGWFDPPMVLKVGYTPECFVDGPLVAAMRAGRVLFINELNRMPESVQNILLPAMDERAILLPKLGRVVAKPGFVVVATQNPREFTATHTLSEALLDRFEMLKIDYQDRDEEIAIVEMHTGAARVAAEQAVDVVRATRQDPAIKRGASVRAAIAIADLMGSGLSFDEACAMALPTRIELISSDEDVAEVVGRLVAGEPTLIPDQKKKRL